MKKTQAIFFPIISIMLFSCNVFPPNIEEIEGMVFVEGGTFTMGDVWSGEAEFDTHRVTLSSYYIAEKEVTTEDFIDFLNGGCA